ncbi:Protein arv1, partial [Schistosoma japonicum]
MERCPNCGYVSDKYVEYDLFLVAIDLLIGRLEAYRHIVHNISSLSFRKLLCMSMLLNAFVSWLSEQPKNENNLANLSISFSSDLLIHIVSVLC